ncbi:MAG: DUF4012 domain-containing protein [Anaerolineae bacterium]
MLILILASVLWLGWSGYRAASGARLALGDLRRLQALAEDPGLQALPVLRQSLADLEGHLTVARAAARPFLWLAPALGWVPEYGPTLRDAPTLLDMAIELAGAGRQALDVMAPLAELPGRAGQGEWIGQMLAAIAAARPQLAAADERLARVGALRQQVRGPLHPRLAPQLERLDRYLPLVRAGLQAAQVAPALMGMDGPRTYLILAQNNDELRPTGGFISGAGHVRLDRGRIVEIRLSDSYAVDNFKQPHPDPPPALREHMGADLLVLRDSNWSPDFPTSAQVARALYAQDQGIVTDGALALDMEAVRLLVAALGPLEVPGRSEPITAANVIAEIKRAWEAPTASADTVEKPTADWFRKRKDFMSEIAAAALARLLDGRQLDLLALGQAVLAMLDERHLQIALADAELAALLAERRWDGALTLPAQGDFLAVIDTNVGFNKANAMVKQQIGYRVAQEGDGLVATLVLTYTHTARPMSADAACERTLKYGDSYQALAERCYWDYLRVYAPADSALIAADGWNGSKTERGEGGATVFSGDFVLRPGAQTTIVLRYRLPPAVAATKYTLTVRKQAGTLAVPLAVQAGPCAWRTDLRQDRMFNCPEE